MRTNFLLLLLFAPLMAQEATISGVVSTQEGAVFPPHLQVEIRSDTASYRTETREDGTFEQKIKPGRYTVTLKAPSAFPYRRAPLDVDSGAKAFVRLIPRLEVPVVGINADGSEFVKRSPPLKYEALLLPGGRPGLLEFEKAGGPPTNRKYTNCVLTVGQWNISAESIVLNHETFQVRLRGNAILEEAGKTRFQGESRAFDLKDLMDLTGTNRAGGTH